MLVEDDWELESVIDVGRLVTIMDTAKPPINEIILRYKERLVSGVPSVSINGVDLQLASTPLASPGLWRMSIIQNAWESHKVRDLVYNTNFRRLRIPVLFPKFYENVEKLSDKDKLKWLKNDVGAYILKNQYRQVRHLGTTWKTFLPTDPTTLYLTELDARHIIYRPTSSPPEARPINGKIPYQEDYVRTQLETAKKCGRLDDYMYYLNSLNSAGYLKTEEWTEFFISCSQKQVSNQEHAVSKSNC